MKRISVFVLVGLLVACAPMSSGGGPDAVTISGFAFQPATLQVKAGTVVTWTNSDAAAHTVTADDGSFDSGSLAQGKSFSHTFTTPATVTYHCTFHPNMVATVSVTAP